ncbi:hypothetical protein GCM10009825_38720 [Arthrobacter humicola]|uniref:Uncharacterized protein n=1 Tax=Arthrobacter humicola TaxID=409291 RepID=A0ABN2ZQ34_9MICC
MLDMNTIETNKQVTTGTRGGGRARVSAPRSKVKHVEVLGRNQGVSTTDPRGPRPLPAQHQPGEPHTPPNVRRAINGLVYIPYADDSQWREVWRRELKQAGFATD